MASRVTGGRRLKRYLREVRRKAERAPSGVAVGIVDDPHVATLAEQLEYGNPKTNLPERPAFRQGVERAIPEARAAIREEAKKGGGVIDRAAAERVGEVAADEIRQAYRSFDGPGLSEAQAARKIGTKGEGRELIGTEGPKLVDRIGSRVLDGTGGDD